MSKATKYLQRVRLPRINSRRLFISGVAAIALIAAFQTFASSGQYHSGPEVSTIDQSSWSAPGRYFLSCAPADGGQCIQSSKDLSVSAPGNYLVTFRTTQLPAGNYTLQLAYQNEKGAVPPGYTYQIRIKLNGKTVGTGADGVTELKTDGKAPWKAGVPVAVTNGEQTISVEWINDANQRGYDTSLGLIRLSLSSQAATGMAAKDDGQRRSDIERYRDALARYVADRGSYPEQSTVAMISADGQPYRALTGTYLQQLLNDPANGKHYFYISNGKRYGLCADLEGPPGTRLEAGPSGSRELKGAAKDCEMLN